jgi:hypothetical protein
MPVCIIKHVLLSFNLNELRRSAKKLWPTPVCFTYDNQISILIRVDSLLCSVRCRDCVYFPSLICTALYDDSTLGIGRLHHYWRLGLLPVQRSNLYS